MANWLYLWTLGADSFAAISNYMLIIFVYPSVLYVFKTPTSFLLFGKVV